MLLLRSSFGKLILNALRDIILNNSISKNKTIFSGNLENAEQRVFNPKANYNPLNSEHLYLQSSSSES